MSSARQILAAWLHAQYDKSYAGSTIEQFGGDADAIIEDLDAAGFAIVPKVPTDAMRRAFYHIEYPAGADTATIFNISYAALLTAAGAKT